MTPTALRSFGGSAATRPALAGDVFGTKNVGILTARQVGRCTARGADIASAQLSVAMPAAYLGPKLVTYFREQHLANAAMDISSQSRCAASPRFTRRC